MPPRGSISYDAAGAAAKKTWKVFMELCMKKATLSETDHLLITLVSLSLCHCDVATPPVLWLMPPPPRCGNVGVVMADTALLSGLHPTV